MKKEDLRKKIIQASTSTQADRIIGEIKQYIKNPAIHRKLTLGQRAADKLTWFAGSWIFIITLLFFLAIWIFVNVLMVINRWDPYPFILLNLILSCLAAIQAPIILMSQNRSAERDRFRAMYDFEVNKKAEREIEDMQQDLAQIKKLITKRR